MQDKGDFSCSCIGNLFAPQEKLFLIRKKDHQEQDLSVSRRGNKSSEFKKESEGKPQKKSLKKRPLSNFSAQNSGPITPADPFKIEQTRGNFEQQDAQFAFSRAEQHAFSAATFMPHPNTTRHIDSPHKQKSYNPYSDQVNYRPNQTAHFFPAPTRTLNLQTPSRQSPSPLPQNQNTQLKHSISLLYSDQYSYQTPIQNGQRPSRQVQGNWMPREQSLLIQDFEKLFNREETPAEDKPQRVRQAQRSKRLQKQLIGRLAESDDDAVSDVPSEVIGKGFENHFSDFWEDGNNAKETLASRTTNTKLSEMQRINQNMEIHNTQQAYSHERNRFGTSVNYKSYKFL